MTEPKKGEPEDDLLEFLGGIDEVNEDSQENDFADFLANTDIEKVAGEPPKKKPPLKEGKSE